MLIQLGYPREAIASLERELLTHLPLAHARIAQSLAIVTYYAQAVVSLTGGSENILQWVISNVCHTENDAENVGDSLQDFIAKIISLEGQDCIGDWNKQIVSTQDGREWVAIHAEDVWGLVDRHFKPATYNKKSLKSLVSAAGGKVDSVQRFAISRDEVLTYNRANINPRLDSDGNEISPNLPRTVTRKAWLLPMELFGDGDTPPSSGGDGGNSPLPFPPPNPSSSTEDWKNNCPVTAVTELLPKTVTSHNVDECLLAADFSPPVTTVTKKINEIKTEQNLVSDQTADNSRTISVNNSGNSGNTVTAEAKTQSPQELPPVTNSVTESEDSLVTREEVALPPSPHAQQPASVAVLPPSQLAAIVLGCKTWVAALEAMEAVATAGGKKRQTVFTSVLKHIPDREDRQHLVKLLAEHIRQFPRDYWTYNWLPSSCHKFKEKAIALANGVTEMKDVGTVEET